jgi:hypothetical protein
MPYLVFMVVDAGMGVFAGLVAIPSLPVPDIVADMVPAPLFGVWVMPVPAVVMAPDCMVVRGIVEVICREPFMVPPTANAWVAKASAATTVTIVTFFISSYLLGFDTSARRYFTKHAKSINPCIYLKPRISVTISTGFSSEFGATYCTS